MHFIYLLARVYPYWALALVMILVQLAIFFRRRKSSLLYSTGLMIVVLSGGIVAWFVFRGDLYSDHWVRAFFGRD